MDDIFSVPTVDTPTATDTNNALAQAIATGQAQTLTLAEANALEQTHGSLLAGSDLRVNDQIIEWAKSQIAEGKQPTFKAKVASDRVSARRTGPSSNSKGQKAYFVIEVQYSMGGKPAVQKVLKPRGAVSVGTVVTVTVSESTQGWNCNVSL